jgi:hypothetical protein
MKLLPQFSTGNRKLQKTAKVLSLREKRKVRVFSFGLPAGYDKTSGIKTCPGAGSCLAVCYARQGQFVIGAPARVRQENLMAIESAIEFGGAPECASILDLAVQSSGIRSGDVVRWHDSGDFYRWEYAAAWTEVARTNPDIRWYTYTKSHSLVADSGLVRLPNVRMTHSEGGKADELIPEEAARSRIFSDFIPPGWVNGNSDDGDLPAIDGEKRIGLLYHGVRYMSDVEKAKFSGKH